MIYRFDWKRQLLTFDSFNTRYFILGDYSLRSLSYREIILNSHGPAACSARKHF